MSFRHGLTTFLGRTNSILTLRGNVIPAHLSNISLRWKPGTRFLATLHKISNRNQRIRILYASQGGTAQLFAQQLAEGLEELEDSAYSQDVSIEGWHEYPGDSPAKLLEPGEALHVFLVSVTGVGDPPDNGRPFYQWITQQEGEASNETSMKSLEYTVFGLGNSKAHPNHYNVIGIELDRRLEKLGASRVFPLGLGDDGDCIEDDFDRWMDDFLRLIQTEEAIEGVEDASGDETHSQFNAESTSSPSTEPASSAAIDSELPQNVAEEMHAVACLPEVLAAHARQGRNRATTRLVSMKYPILDITAPLGSSAVRHDLFHLQGTHHQFYSNGAVKLRVSQSRSLSADGGESGLREIAVKVDTQETDDGYLQKTAYRTGDQLLVYPRNSNCMVQALLDVLDVHPHAVIEAGPDSYPFPVGLTLYETLSHCVDLGALPSPAFSRFLTGRQNLDYKNEIANPRRTVIDLLLEEKRRISVEDLLFNLTPMKGRYYSIASSNLCSPHEVLLTYRPIKYMTSRGSLREGVCTSYMSTMGVTAVELPASGKVQDVSDSDACQYLTAAVHCNPKFRLPENPKTPILLIAGGCGVAPIRAFVEERLSLLMQSTANGYETASKFGPAFVYLGFRTPEDEVYSSLIQRAVSLGALTDAKVAYSSGVTDENFQYCMNVNKLVRLESEQVWNHLESGGYTYLCGGARTFGAAIYQELMDIIQEHGQDMDIKGAEDYLRDLLDTGRLLEDLAD